VLEFVWRDSVDSAKAFLVKKGFDFDFVVGDPEDVCKRLARVGVDVTVPRGPLVDQAARAGAMRVFRYLATSTDKFAKTTMSASFAGGVLEIIRLVEARVSFASATAVEAAEWAAEALRRWNFEVAEWLLRERPDVVADTMAARVVWLTAAKARDLATLRTLPSPEFKFDGAGAHFLALLCGPKGTDLSDARGIVARALVSDDVEALALLSWAFSWAVVEHAWSGEGWRLTLRTGISSRPCGSRSGHGASTECPCCGGD
jgi:hypothetical protein